VARDLVDRGEDGTGEVVVSTVFLGLDHNFSMVGPPLLFETMVFGGPLNGECRRYATWVEAEAGHREVVAQAQEAAAARTRRRIILEDDGPALPDDMAGQQY
jgi:hypothetical protein